LGAPLKILHAADLHLDSPLLGLPLYEAAPVERIRSATRRAFENLVGYALEHQVDVVVIAGDLFDGDWRDYAPGLFFSAQMSRLRQAGVRVVWLRGNHDAASKIRRHLRLPDNVAELATSHPQTIELESLGLAIHGQGFAKRDTTEDLAASYPRAIPGVFNLALLHTALEGRPGHDSYAPCTLNALRDKGYQYWALGHVHTREVLCEEPWVVFPGNLQGRFVRESGAKGATLIEVVAGRVVRVEALAFDVVRFGVCHVEASDCSNPDDILDVVRRSLNEWASGVEDRLLALRVVISGATRAHAALHRDEFRYVEEVRNAALDVPSGDIWIEDVRFQTQALGQPTLSEAQDGIVRELLSAAASLRQGDELKSEFDALFKKLGELRLDPTGEDLGGPLHLERTLEQAQELLLARLAEVTRS